MPKLCPLFSGSSGNCYYIGSAGGGVLIDAGRSAKQIEAALMDREIDIKSIQAVFVTHEHVDHVQGLRVFASKYGLRVYASPGTVKALWEKGYVNEKVDISELLTDGMELDSIRVMPFHTSHDCAEGYGYIIETADGRRTAFATDTGCVTDEMRIALGGCDTAVIESNHDVGMLQNGIYPYVLKRRILSDKGHLSNDVCAATVSEMVRGGTTRFLLAHLSKENNIPELAEQTSLCTLTLNGMKRNIDYRLDVLGEKNNRTFIY